MTLSELIEKHPLPWKYVCNGIYSAYEDANGKPVGCGDVAKAINKEGESKWLEGCPRCGEDR